ncbi:MAG: hypothetical protein ACK4MV_03220 [Beijerinckiaceae bacterium]
MERKFLTVLVIALVVGPLAALAVAVGARSSEPNFDKAPPLTITSRAADGLSAAPGLRFTDFDADGCAFVSRAVIDERGSVRTVNDLFCKH